MHMFFRFRVFSAQPVGFEHVVLEDLQRLRHVGNLVRAAGRDLGSQVACGNGFHAVLQTYKTTNDATANIIPADDKCCGKTDEREANQDDPALLDLRL